MTGQNGVYLAQLLLYKEYEIRGTSRCTDRSNLGNLRQLGVSEKISTYCMAIEDLSSVQRVLEEVQPDEITTLRTKVRWPLIRATCRGVE